MDTTIAGTYPQATRVRGAATMTRILDKAVHIASVEGLESMSLATLAKATSMSKSGLFAHFRNKEALQLATIDEAERIFFEAVVTPSQSLKGIERLSRMIGDYSDCCALSPFRGGCFFAAAAHEFDGRPGAVRERVVTFFERWHDELRSAALQAIESGQVRADLDVEQLTFDVDAIGLAVNLAAQLGAGADRARGQGRAAAAALLGFVQSMN